MILRTYIFTILFLISFNLFSNDTSDLDIGTITFKDSTFTQENKVFIQQLVKWYSHKYRTCTTQTIVTFIDDTFVTCGDYKDGEAVGCTAYYLHNFCDVTVAIKEREQCDIGITIIHELLHACEGFDDCYSEWNYCWAKKLRDKTEEICSAIRKEK